VSHGNPGLAALNCAGIRYLSLDNTDQASLEDEADAISDAASGGALFRLQVPARSRGCARRADLEINGRSIADSPKSEPAVTEIWELP
jgi:hypothetical protein